MADQLCSTADELIEAAAGYSADDKAKMAAALDRRIARGERCRGKNGYVSLEEMARAADLLRGGNGVAR